jgi:hypothetical protein
LSWLNLLSLKKAQNEQNNKGNTDKGFGAAAGIAVSHGLFLLTG